MIRMLKDNLLVKPVPREQIGQIILPNSVPDDWCRGVVRAVGPGLPNFQGEIVPVDIAIGEIVIYPPSRMEVGYPTVLVQGENLIILPYQLVWGVEEGIILDDDEVEMIDNSNTIVDDSCDEGQDGYDEDDCNSCPSIIQP